jgi:hypothetical protein
MLRVFLSTLGRYKETVQCSNDLLWEEVFYSSLMKDSDGSVSILITEKMK